MDDPPVYFTENDDVHTSCAYCHINIPIDDTVKCNICETGMLCFSCVCNDQLSCLNCLIPVSNSGAGEYLRDTDDSVTICDVCKNETWLLMAKCSVCKADACYKCTTRFENVGIIVCSTCNIHRESCIAWGCIIQKFTCDKCHDIITFCETHSPPEICRKCTNPHCSPCARLFRSKLCTDCVVKCSQCKTLISKSRSKTCGICNMQLCNQRKKCAVSRSFKLNGRHETMIICKTHFNVAACGHRVYQFPDLKCEQPKCTTFICKSCNNGIHTSRPLCQNINSSYKTYTLVEGGRSCNLCWDMFSTYIVAVKCYLATDCITLPNDVTLMLWACYVASFRSNRGK